MARRKKNNPGVLGTTLIVLAVVGGLGYLAVRATDKELKKVKKKVKESGELKPWSESLPGDQVLVDEGEFVGSEGRTQWRIYLAPLGPDEDYFIVTYRSPLSAGMDTMATSDEAQAWIQQNLK